MPDRPLDRRSSCGARAVAVETSADDGSVVAARGTERAWLDEQGWGVVDSPETPGGCWTHFSAVAVTGFARLEVGQEVLLEWEEATQDGFAYRAVRTWPGDRQPVDPVVEPGGTGASRSTSTITYDGDAAEYGTR
jgi:CspA family cold shock protein